MRLLNLVLITLISVCLLVLSALYLLAGCP
jgi:hypothetical protein